MGPLGRDGVSANEQGGFHSLHATYTALHLTIRARNNSLVLLVIEAGIDIDLDTLKLIGTRGFIIAFFGSIFPIAIGLAVAFSLGLDTKGAIAAGASFGPTSLGIALNILKSGGVLNT